MRELAGFTPNALDDMDLSAEKCELIRLEELHALRPEASTEEEEAIRMTTADVGTLSLRSGEPSKKLAKVVCLPIGKELL